MVLNSMEKINDTSSSIDKNSTDTISLSSILDNTSIDESTKEFYLKEYNEIYGDAKLWAESFKVNISKLMNNLWINYSDFSENIDNWMDLFNEAFDFYLEIWATKYDIERIQRSLWLEPTWIFDQNLFDHLSHFQRENSFKSDWKAWYNTLLFLWLIFKDQNKFDFYGTRLEKEKSFEEAELFYKENNATEGDIKLLQRFYWYKETWVLDIDLFLSIKLKQWIEVLEVIDGQAWTITLRKMKLIKWNQTKHDFYWKN